MDAEERDEWEEFFFEHDDLFKCTNQKLADEWVKIKWDLTDSMQKLAIVRAYLQYPLNKGKKKVIKPKKVVGGNVSGDIRITRMLAVGDMYHDFTPLASHPSDPPTWLTLPNGVTINRIQKEREFLNLMTRQASFTFGDEDVKNPLYLANFYEKQFDASHVLENLDVEHAKHIKSTESRVGNHYHIIPVDIWEVNELQQTRKAAVFRLQQVAQVIGVLRKTLGTETTVIADASGDNLVTMVICLDCVNRSIYQKICEMIEGPDPDGIKGRIREIMMENEIVEGNWKVIRVDANVFDSSAISIKRSEMIKDPTGSIYPPEMAGYQVILGGIHGGSNKVKVDMVDIDGKQISLMLTGPQCSRSFTINAISEILEYRQQGLRIATSKEHCKAEIQYVSTDLLFGLKRAGDWGQIEACAKHNYVFFTRDKYAGLYAYYRGIRFVYVSTNPYVNEDGSSLMQYTFTVCQRNPVRQ